MARQVLPFVGAAVGFVASGGNPMGAQIGFALGSIVGNAVDPQVLKGPAIGEAALQTSAEGVFRPIVFGTAAIKGNVIVRGNRQVRTQRTSQGKGGGPVTEEQRVYWTFAIRLSEPIQQILRIWQDEKLVYDIRPGSSLLEESAQYAGRFRFYDGSEDQLPDPDLEAFQGMGNTSAYRGSAYVVFPNFDLTDRRESIPDFRFEVASIATTVVPDTVNVGPTFPPTDPSNPGGNLFMDGDGPPKGLTNHSGTGWNILLGQSYEVTTYDAELNVVSTEWIENVGGPLSSTTMVPVGINGTGWAVSSDGSSGKCKLCFNGESVAELRPTAGTTGTWWFNEAGFHPEYAGLVWFRGNNVFIGVRTTGNGSGIDWNSIFRWPLADVSGAVVPAQYTLPGISSDPTGEAFWMHVSRQGIVRTVNSDSLQKAYSETLSFLADEVIPPEVLTTITGLRFCGFGVDDALDLAAYVDFDLNLRVYRKSSGELLSTLTLPLAGGTPFLVTRVMINEDAIYVQRRDRTYYVSLIESSDGTYVPLSYIVSTCHERANHPLYDVSELTDLVKGVAFAGDYTAADAIRTLMPVYKFDGSEYDSGSGYRIHYPKRGKPVVTTLTEDSLIDAPERSVREDAIERPKKLHLHYENPTIGYAPAKATILRSSPDVMVVGERSVQVPVAFEEVDEPAQIADRLMRIAWVEVGGEEEFTIPDNLIGLIPSDCVGVSLRGQTRRMRIVSQEVGPGRIRLRMLPDRQSAYTSNVTGVPVPEPTPPLPSIVGQTIHEFMDLPALNDGNDSLIWYESATGQTEAWYGAQTQRKIPPATEFENSATFNQNSIMGVLLDAVPSASEHYTDTTNVVRVQLYLDDAIDSITELEFLSEGGSFALEKPDGSWEVMQYMDSDDEGSQTFALSHLARGRLNSGASSHNAGARFVLLVEGVLSVPAITAWIGASVTTRAVSFGTSPDTAIQSTDTYTAKSQTEFPVAHLFLSRNVNTINVSTVPRHRFGTEDNPVQSINWLGYRWTATDGTNTASIPDGTATSVSFDATGWSSPITVTVSQLNRFTGPGPAVSEQIA